MKKKFIDKKGIKFKPNHKEVEKAIEEYLAKGGTITQLDRGPGSDDAKIDELFTLTVT